MWDCGLVDDSREADLEGKFSDGVDGGREGDCADDVGGWEQTGTGSFRCRLQGTFDGEDPREWNGFREASLGMGAELVFDVSEHTVGCGREVAGN